MIQSDLEIFVLREPLSSETAPADDDAKAVVVEVLVVVVAAAAAVAEAEAEAAAAAVVGVGSAADSPLVDVAAVPFGITAGGSMP